MLSLILSLFFFLLGLIIGSFLNVVILRYNTGLGISGRSGCFSCGKKLEWYELIPVVSFIVQKGRCRKCGAVLSLQYPLVELLTGFLFLGIFLKYYFLSLSYEHFFFTVFFYLVIWSLLVVILVYDLRHKIIPDMLVYGFAFLAFVRVLVDFRAGFSLAELLAGPILFLPFYLLWHVSQGRWIGLGDGKLALGIGWMLGLGYGLSAIVLGFWIGAIVSLILLGLGRLKLLAIGLTMKSEIPFAPFLILGLALVYFIRIDVVGVHTIFGI